MNAPMLLPFLSLGCGIIFASLGLGIWGGASIVFLGIIVYFTLISVARNPVKAYRFAAYHYLWLVLLFLGIGCIAGDLSLPYQPKDRDIKDAIIAEGKVVDIRNRTTGDQLSIEIQSLYYKNGLRKDYSNFKIDCFSDAVSVRDGDIVALPINGIRKIKNSPNSFNKGYEEAKAKQGVFYNIRVEGKNIKKIGHDRLYIAAYAQKMRDAIVSFIEKQPLQRETKNFIITLLTGDRAYLDPDLRQTFADAGIAHVLALSGMHLAIIAGLFLSLLFPLNFLGKYKLRYFLTALLLWFYAFITGMSPSIVRACVMTSTFIIAMILERKNTTLNSLCLAGFIILLFTPQAIYEIGFQLSFLCVGSLILFAPRLNPIDHRRHPRLYNICGLTLASLITTFTSWIVVAYYFQTFPTLFLPANIIILPFLPFYVTSIIIYLCLGACGVHIEIFGKAIDFIYDTFVNIISFFGNETVLHLSVPSTSVILWLTGIILLSVYIQIRKYKWMIALSSLCFLSSIGITMFLKPEVEKGFIICHTYPNLQVNISNGISENLLDIPGNALSLHKINNHNLIIIDFDSIPKDINPLTSDYLILTGKYKGDISRIKEIFNPKQIITHSSIRKKRESELIEEARKLNIPVHSLREKNALKVIVVE